LATAPKSERKPPAYAGGFAFGDTAQSINAHICIHAYLAYAYNACMGRMESEIRRRARKNELKNIVLGTVKAAGILSLALAAPKVVTAMQDLGLISTKRQSELVRRSYQRLIGAGLLVSDGTSLRLTRKGEAALRRMESLTRSRRKPRKMGWKMARTYF
jgi:hypothetical protein